MSQFFGKNITDSTLLSHRDADFFIFNISILAFIFFHYFSKTPLGESVERMKILKFSMLSPSAAAEVNQKSGDHKIPSSINLAISSKCLTKMDELYRMNYGNITLYIMVQFLT